MTEQELRALGARYWRDEVSGVLAPAVEAFLRQEPMDETEVALVRAYLVQWIEAPIWRMNPHDVPEGFDGLIAQARKIASREDIKRWILCALDFGIDPL